ncbi:1,4-alpha-glucan branching enzyme [Metabacillus sp. 84]|uniref:1,4-alpha-glucan branching enzyme n=1 Tax=unclassified Metabacillus TaxID=2675274 RepID=UPI003CF8D98E
MIASPTDFEVHLFHEGNLFKSYEQFGAHLKAINGVNGVQFTVWAPHAKDVRIAGDFNKWKGSGYSLEKVSREGIWSGFFPDLKQGDVYKYELITRNGSRLLKADPFAFYSEVKPNTASVIANIDGYTWNDQKWQKKKKAKTVYQKPFFIYELNLASWKKKDDGSFYTYKEIADELIPYVIEHGFTHIELMPVIEHPFDRSWGYQGTGYFAATSRYGKPEEFMELIDLCHQNDLGVIMDWVPGHFCKDAHGLYMFDGEPVYEYSNYSDRENVVWGTANFDLGKPEVHSFLISNALFWLEKYHIDGFRVDAVANMLYWPNSDSDAENPYAVSFIKKLNEKVHEFDPHALMIAEDSTDWPLVTAPVSEGGLGFQYKWNMGWMNDVLEYMETDQHARSDIHHKMTFSLMYAFNENFILPFSHDEVVHGKKSLLNKMPGDYWQKFAQLRLLMGYMLAHPGKKLLFMGSEFGQFDEWKDLEELDWFLEDYELHRKTRVYFKEMMSIYKKQRPLYELDHSPEGFEWIDADNAGQSIYSFIRRGLKDGELLIAVCNFRSDVYHDYKIGVPADTRYVEILNSDDPSFGGSGQINGKEMKAEAEELHGQPYSIKMTVPPFGFSLLRAIKKRKENNNEKEMRSNASGRGKGQPS